VQASREHKQRILVQIALGDIKFRDEQFNWLIVVQASGGHKQRILVQIAVDSAKTRDENFN
jgi:hypothetical protein